MGKKRTVNKGQGSGDAGMRARSIARVPKKKLDVGVLYVRATYNNTQVTLADTAGNTIISSSSGGLGFKGAKKSTPFAAAKVGELIGDKANLMGVKEVSVIIKGVGAGRESAMRSFATKGIAINRIVDKTPVPFNGPRPKKARRV
jgi:small subunit ribosomal protein S11